jgi:Flp pilus assembly secretin CpaC
MTRTSIRFRPARCILLGCLLFGLLAITASSVTAETNTPASKRDKDVAKLEKQLGILFPNSKVYLIPFQNRWIVKGQSQSKEESARIIQIIRSARDSDAESEDSVIDMLEVPAPPQVMLNFKVVELAPAHMEAFEIALQAMQPNPQKEDGGNIRVVRILDNKVASNLLTSIANRQVGKVLASPTLTVLSGHVASFLCAGDISVPTIGGTKGEKANFRGFGQSLLVRPDVVDSDWISLQLTPEFTSLDSLPKVHSRKKTTVRLREGQTVVLTGLSSSNERPAEGKRIPFLGDLLFVGPTLWRNQKRGSDGTTELLFILTPELVRPMRSDEIPPLAGSAVSPNDIELYTFTRSTGPADLEIDFSEVKPVALWDGSPTVQNAPWTPSPTNRLDHLKVARDSLRAAGLKTKAKEVELEILTEELATKRQELEAIQRQVQELRTSIEASP